MKLHLSIALVFASALAAPVHAADPLTSATGGNLSKSDREFVEKATIGGMTEVQASKVAQGKSADANLKGFADRMVQDHTKAGAELQKIATAKGVTPPGALDDSHKKDVEKLDKESAKDFDKAYAKKMVSDHKDTVSLFEKEAKSGDDADLKAFASKTLPTIKEHLTMIEGLEKQMK